MPTLNFKGKTFVQNHHLAVKYHQLVPKKELSLTDKVCLHDNLIIQGDNRLVSGLSTEQKLLDNLKMNCVPTEIMKMSIDDYQGFLTLRRKLMAQKIKEYYKTQ